MGRIRPIGYPIGLWVVCMEDTVLLVRHQLALTTALLQRLKRVL